MKFFAYLKLLALSLFQRKIIFKPRVKGLNKLGDPIEYNFPLTQEAFIYSGKEKRKIYLWIKQPENKRPMVVFFQGNTGHIADVGAPEKGEFYDRDYRLKLLREITKSGFGFTYLSHSGYGKSEGKPSEKNSNEDLVAFAEFLKKESNEETIILAESLGCWSALKLNEELLKLNVNVKIVSIIAPFTSIIQKAIDLDNRFSAFKLEKYIKNKLDNLEIISNSTYKGKLIIFTPELDTTTQPIHSEKLLKEAQKKNLNVKQKILKGAEHIVWENKEIVEFIEENL